MEILYIGYVRRIPDLATRRILKLSYCQKTNQNQQPTIDQPGPPPEEPIHPGRRAHFIPQVWYYVQRWRWRNHYRKQSPWWDWYRKYLKSGAWKEVREKALIRDGHRCQTKGCGRKAVQVHHKYYRYVGREWEQMSCLVSICKQHHD